MTLDEKLSKLEIKKILVADDLPENIAAAKETFSRYSVLHVDYASSEREAKQKISENCKTSNYDLILTDMNMESRTSGLNVMDEGMKYHTLAAIVTGIDPTIGGHAHGAQTRVMMGLYNKTYDGQKSRRDIWNHVIEGVADYLSGEGSALYRAMQRYRRYNSELSEDLKDLGKLQRE